MTAGVFSRDQPQRLYLQDRLLGNADELAAKGVGRR
jgi:sulfite reductase alpha subunit-like flavoprotein